MTGEPTPEGRARKRLGGMARRRGRWTVLGGGLAGLLAGISALTPWWYTSAMGSATSSLAEFFPGANLYAGGGGGGGYVSYAGVGAGQLGNLYEAVLAGTIAVMLLSWAVAGLVLASARRRGTSRLQIARWLAWAGLAVAVLLAALIPLLQPALLDVAGAKAACSAGTSSGPCSSFWGSTTVASTRYVWGAGAGWWLDLGAVILLALVVVLLLPRPNGD